MLIENMENWIWFLDHMKQSFNNIKYKSMVLISNRDKGLQAMVYKILSQAYHSYCS
jgi:hypothetical protein